MIVFEKHVEYGNPIVDKSFLFASRILKLYLIKVREEYHLKDILNHLLKSGTSIGANVSESQEASSKKDFQNKLSIALKEARETEYWLKLLTGSLIINEKEFNSLYKDCDELIRLLISIIKKLKEN